MKHIFTTTALAMALLITPAASWSQESQTAEQPAETSESPLTAVLEAVRVDLVQAADGTMVEKLVPADTVLPGNILEYTGSYTNISASSLIGLIVNGPIPASTNYVEGTQSVSIGAVFEVLIEGEDWQEIPAYKTVTDENGQPQKVEASASDYAQLRWRLTEPLDPEGVAKTTYRVIVDN